MSKQYFAHYFAYELDSSLEKMVHLFLQPLPRDIVSPNEQKANVSFGRLKQANKDLLRGLHDAEQRIACLGMADGMIRGSPKNLGDYTTQLYRDCIGIVNIYYPVLPGGGSTQIFFDVHPYLRGDDAF